MKKFIIQFILTIILLCIITVLFDSFNIELTTKQFWLIASLNYFVTCGYYAYLKSL